MKNVYEAALSSVRVYQIELTNHCNATCTYCPQPTHARERGFMTEATFRRVLEVMENRSVLLHHFGESLLHRELEKFVAIATSAGVAVGISTNGRTLTQKRLDDLYNAGLRWMRLHTDPFNVRARNFVVQPDFELTEHRLLVKNDAPKKELQSFAGYLDVEASGPGPKKCSYIVDAWRVVLWSGEFGLCCNDVEGVNNTSLCASCSGYVFTDPLDWGAYGGK